VQVLDFEHSNVSKMSNQWISSQPIARQPTEGWLVKQR
jgi:hypothetical protein